MNNINLKYNNNYEIARQIFESAIRWDRMKSNQTSESLIGEIEKTLDKIEKRGDYSARAYNMGYKDGLEEKEDLKFIRSLD